jgi:DNA-directed RNA polymerase specialized sigma24 family protein
MADPDTVISEELAAHREAIHRYIRGIVRDAALAEDLTQETLLRAHQKAATLEEGGVSLCASIPSRRDA